MELSDLQEIRRRKAAELRTRGLDPHPPRAVRTHTAGEALARFAAIEPPLESCESTAV